MKTNRKDRCLLAAVGVISIVAGSFIPRAPQARADEAVDWCDTYENWVAEVGNQRAVASAECPTYGTCDTPSVRDSWSPNPSTPMVTIRVRFHVFCEDDGASCAASPSDVAAQMDQLNFDYAPRRIQFTETGEPEYHDDSAYRQLASSEVSAMKTTYADDPAHQVNVYVADLAAGLLGRGTFPWSLAALGDQGGIIIDETAFGPGREVLTHEVGHNLGLWHTHHGVFEVEQCSACYERADGVDGDITGDFASDTPPTPLNYSCSDPSEDDPCSVPATPWAPTQPENYMGYGQDPCWTLFTPQQAGRKHCWIHDVLMGWIACATSEECDDRSECTEDLCVDAVCQNDPYPDSTPCTGGVCCGGSCVCSTAGDCDDANACTTDACENAGTCGAVCTNTWPACDPATPDGCCGPTCTSGSDFDCHCGGGTCDQGEDQCICPADCGTPPTTEVAGSTCQDGVDNDCDGYADCNDVVDCEADSACFCDDNGGNSPLVCIYWDDPLPPQAGQDFVLDPVTDPPNVTFVTGNEGWKIWSQISPTDDTPANLGHVGIGPELATENFSVTLAHGASPGAASVESIALVAQDWTGQSNLAGGSIAGDLSGDLVVQESGGQGGLASFIIGGDLLGDIMLPRVDNLEVKGAVSSNSTVTLSEFVGARTVRFNTDTGEFAGDLSLPTGLPYGSQVYSNGLLTGSVDLNGNELAGLLSLQGGSGQQSQINAGALNGELRLLGGTYAGTVWFSSMGPGGSIVIRSADLHGSIQVDGDWDGFLDLADGTIASEAFISIGGDLNGSIGISGNAAGDILVSGMIYGAIDVSGEFNGDICGANLTRGMDPLPGNITIGTQGPNMTVCGANVGCGEASAVVPQATAQSCISDGDCTGGRYCAGPSSSAYCTEPKNRFLSIANPGTPDDSAIRVTLASLYVPGETASGTLPNFSCHNGQVRWVGGPSAYAEDIPGLLEFLAAPLVDEPRYRNWSTSVLALEFPDADPSVIHVYGPEVMPSSSYDVQVIQSIPGASGETCLRHVEGNYSETVTVRTGAWGDVKAPFGLANFVDIGAIVASYKRMPPPDGLPHAQAVIRDRKGANVPPLRGPTSRDPSGPNFVDIMDAVKAFKRTPYDNEGPRGTCPEV